ncbi:related to phosphatidylserine decarboxylase proenzyme 2 precursor [Serendipita indica DSM 11827]|uniref:Related to phosphatidylserine decarboxylase proenzyme 2 n=1 Tax=Serendipita indica (strain DSM 11827) TaxID=1109443 RepID=G4T6Z4_SERID|nr:related to phosphatidylserine decarboxylase proenzyme 2 precursor [Serendipita indica DSM 11827]
MSFNLSRPVAKKEAIEGGVVKAWRDLKWKLQPEAVNMRKVMMLAMEQVVEGSRDPKVNEHDILEQQGWLSDLFDPDTYEKLFADEHWGNFIIVRSTGVKDFEYMPIYARVGMHLLFYGPLQLRLLGLGVVRNLLKAQTVKQGKVYDEEGPEVVKRVEDFVKTYKINMKEALLSKPSEYKTFNQFFSRKLKPGLRPVASPKDASVIVSAADCRLSVFPNFQAARQFWVKGKKFTLPELLGSAELAQRFGANPSLAIFRLAPQDYHRFHSPVNATIESIKNLPGEYYTVNPQAVNQNLDVFTGNRRDVCILNAVVSNTTPPKTVPVAFVAIGALLVGAVGWSFKVGDSIQRGDDLGWFQYGGSTVVCVFAEEAKVTWDDDLIKASTGEWKGKEVPEVMSKIPEKARIAAEKQNQSFGVEVLVRVGEKIGIAALTTT